MNSAFQKVLGGKEGAIGLAVLCALAGVAAWRLRAAPAR